MKDISRTQLLLITEATEEQLAEWEAKEGEGTLRSCKTGRYKYDGRQFFEWYFNNVHKPEMTDDEGLSTKDHKLRYEKARAAKAEIKFERLDKKLILDLDAEAAIGFTEDLFNEIVDEICDTLPGKIAGRSEEDILIQSDKTIRKILLSISKEVESAPSEESNSE